MPLMTEKHGSQGSIRIRVVFSPALVIHARRSTSTAISTPARVVTNVGAIPMGVGKGVGKGILYGGKGIIHGVGNTVGFAGRKTGLIKKHDKHGNEVLVPESDGEQHGVVPTGEGAHDTFFSADEAIVAQGPKRVASAVPAIAPESTGAQHDPLVHESRAEAINVTCVKTTLGTASSHEVKPYVQLSLGHKTYKTGHAKRVDAEW